MKKWIIFIFLINLMIVNAEESKVFVLSANYDNGKIIINDVAVKNGYAPDRKIAVDSDYSINIYSKEKKLLYRKNIEIPLYIYIDVIVNGEIEGNLIKLNQTDFALVLPYYEDAGEIDISKDNEEAASYILYNKLSFKNISFVYYFVGILVLAILVFLVIKKRK